MDKITDEDINLLQYFHAKGDLTRWGSWAARKPVIAKKYPELIAAMDALVVAKRTLDAIVESLEAGDVESLEVDDEDWPQPPHPCTDYGCERSDDE
jgi:hypothetical protein